jgi:hypothetical protein
LKNAGLVRLEIADCDAPDMNCDWIFAEIPGGEPGPTAGREPEPITVVAYGYISLDRNWGADLDSGKVFQSGEARADKPRPGSDLVLSQVSGSWLLIPVNGASVSQTDCVAPKFGKTAIRLDGMGPGVEFCVQTDRKSYSHVFIVDEIRSESSTIRLWHVTRKWKLSRTG